MVKIIRGSKRSLRVASEVQAYVEKMKAESAEERDAQLARSDGMQLKALVGTSISHPEAMLFRME